MKGLLRASVTAAMLTSLAVTFDSRANERPKLQNSHWHQPLTLNFDSETMPDWFGLPEDGDLPSTYSIEYVRAWKKAK